ncbi:MAG: suppressor of fused domain protein [Crocinitomicaceae bacterium]|nr:suppressor of fused domain protein [Crocinitomicaceae bacterium]
MSELKESLISRLGEHRVLEAPTQEGEIPLLILDLELKSPVTVIVTNGLSDYRMPVPEKLVGKEHNELYFCLPNYWEWEDAANPNMNWVFPWIQRLAKFVVEKETWFGHGHTMPCGKEELALSNSMQQNHFLLSDPILLEQELAPIDLEDKTIHFLGIIPVFKDEFQYKQSRGTFKLLTKFMNKGVTEKLDDFRYSVNINKWRLKR